MIIYLIGMPGSGKSTVGKELAKLLQAEFTDLDEYISRKEKLSIPQIFKTKGEAYFRRTESASLQELADRNKTIVVATGGGTPCYNNNMPIMLKNGKTVYLEASPATLAQRIENDTTIRPLFSRLKGKKLLEKVTSMLEHRGKFYTTSPLRINTENKTAAEAAGEIQALLS
jgi:shikimate kinase